MKIPTPRRLSSGNYFIQLRLGGESITVTAPTEKECKQQAALIKAEYRAGVKKKKKPSVNATLYEAIDNYILSKKVALSPSTIRGYKCIQNNRFQSAMHRKIKDIDNWQELCNIEAKRLAPKTVINAWGLIASVLQNVGIEVPDVKLPMNPKKERPYLEPESIPVFIKALKGQKCEIPALLGLLSLRSSEIHALTWDNVDLKNKRILVAGAVVQDENQKFVVKPTNKTAASYRYVPILIPELLDALNAIEDKTGRVVKQNPNTLFRQINAVCDSVGLPRIGVHGLRHSFASLAYHLRIPEQVAMQIGGWSDYGTMRKIYTHLSQKDVDKYAQELKQFFENANHNAN